MPALLPEHVGTDFTLFNADPCLPPSPSLADAVAYALQKCPGFKFLPSNYDSLDTLPANASPATAHFSCDDFRMYEFKVRRCMRGRSHDWTECPFAHPGEKARRRDPRRIHYSGSPCPDFRKGSCRRGDACEFAHGVFECWLHPARYRTQVCKDGKSCKRRVCFFAHSPEQLRILPVSMACAPTSMHPHTEKKDGSRVGSPGGVQSPMKGSSESLPSNELFMSSSVGMSRAHHRNSLSALSLPPCTVQSAAQVSPKSMHLDLPNGSTLRRAMVQNIIACRGYGTDLNAAEYSSVPDGYEALLRAQMVCASHPNIVQPLHIRNCNNESVYPKYNMPLENSSFELGGHSAHGFASPTSTLAGHVFSPPPLSPPLSPLTSPNGDQIKDSFSNLGSDFHNFYVDDTNTQRRMCEPGYMYNDLSYMEELGFRLQNLNMARGNDGCYVPPQSSHVASVRGGQVGVSTQQLRLPSFRHPPVSNLSCTSKQALWGRSSDVEHFQYNDNSLLQVGDGGSGYVEVGASRVGEESAAMDNLIPDFGWVSELVK